ncbi:MAG TPA: trypsin-like peptidase domain-containing protein [Candidatus Micrarchaeia archaeon]|nr:trypsin-like peptidase domain-containing protein [Candidatus Micrarchaeia archaeon]
MPDDPTPPESQTPGTAGGASEPGPYPDTITPDAPAGGGGPRSERPPGDVSPHGAEPDDHLIWAAPGDAAGARRRARRLRLPAALAAAAILGGGLVAAGEQVFGVGGGTPGQLSIANGSRTPTVATGGIDAAVVAAKVQPAIVDVSSQVMGVGGVGTSAGTGMIVTGSGAVVTNNHVVQGATSVRVQMPSRHRSYPARVIAVDPSQDIALLQMTGVSGLPTVTFANRSSIRVGEAVVAIGNAYGLGGAPSVTSGTIVATNRAVTASDGLASSEHLTGMLETNASLARGDSGGPLVDAAGHVVGMDTAANTSPNAQASGTIAFAIPSGRLTQVVRAIQDGAPRASIVRTRTAFLGVDVENATGGGAFGVPGTGPGTGASTTRGALVVAVVPRTPAAQIGLQPGDIIVSADGRRVTTRSVLSAVIKSKRPGQRITLTWQAGATTSRSAVTLAEGPVA